MSEPLAPQHAIEWVGVSKRFGAFEANHDVTLRVATGSIHAIVGENGAGKSTLLKIAYGSVRADAGVLRIAGADVALARHSPAAAIARGVGMVHQHFMLVPTLTVAENVVLGREPTRGGALDLAAATQEIRAVARRVEREIDPRRLLADLSVGEQQYVEIIKVLWRGARVLLLDEPTAVLTPGEVGPLFGVLRTLAKEGATIVLVTHKLDEVAAIADRVTVMRRGRVVAEFERGADRETIAAAMIGSGSGSAESASDSGSHGSVSGSELPALQVEALTIPRPGGGIAVADVSFSLHPGEILGIAGVQGNGQSELLLALAGLLPAHSGRVRIAGRDVTEASPAARAAAGLGHIPEDRHRRGLILDFTLAENLILGRQREFARLGSLDRHRIATHAAERIAALDVRPPDAAAPASALSGGNQQKLVVARELSRPGLRVLLCAEPTRGVDIGAAAAIHGRLQAARDAGAAILVVSSDLTELRAVASRILVVHRGRIAAELPVAAATDEALGAYMTGARAAVPAAEGAAS